ncbi:ABC transporter substrate-binding protein [Pseudoclavibacter sp. AY1F1]|uniref:ABC transporter substrate-binding protein n=1 Tax=Pseudoclavibacter sp. AY1F1 TaxID=2080583 RepID=UPI000CE74836|nr:ABC transporter substrate-binding protein [Pseudoclavibacter sp. AY1F1]PPF45422.1 ABC transporter substrate-binding protein [Pseudoclavibacter sp. AY1F1]
MKLAKKRLVAVAATLAATALLAGCAGGGAQNGGPAAGGAQTLTLGILGEPTSWDPSQAHVGHSLQPYQIAYDTLILREPDGTLSPMLAEEWSYNEDRTVLTLELRDDVTFSDGAAFDAEAVKANIENLKNNNGRQAAQVAAVSVVEPVDADTVTITLSQPDPAFEYYLSQAAGLMGSPASLATDGIIATPVGSGPYVMDTAQSVTGSQLVFTAREDYWNPELQKFGSVVLKPYEELTARLNALLSNQVDATILDASTAEQATAGDLATIEDYQVDWQGLLLFDRAGETVPALGDVKVRQAINFAIDRDTMLTSILRGYGDPTQQVFGPDSGAFVDDLDSAYNFDPDRARKLLAEAGYADGFELPIAAGPGFESALAALSQQLADVGITVKIETVNVQTFLDDLTAGKYPVLYQNLFQGEPWVAINQIISTEAIYNPFDSTDPELQALIAEVQAGGDESADRAQAVNKWISDNAWFAPVYRIDQVYTYHSDLITVEKQVQQAVPSIYNYAPAA